MAESHEAEIRGCLANEAARSSLSSTRFVIFCLQKNASLAFFDRIGVPKERRLSINSADDSSTGGVPRDFCAGRDADPMKSQVLIATSSIEMGVTFRAGLMLMDPGFDALSFVQRVGRVARGDEPGTVLVRASEQMRNGREWLRRLVLELKKES